MQVPSYIIMVLRRTTELEAVNTMLTAIGEAPVNSLTSSNLTQDAAIALSILAEVNRTVQSDGWHFNTEFKVEFSRDSSNYIPISQNILHIDVDSASYSEEVIIRGDYLYDTTKKTGDRYAFNKDLVCDVIYLLDFTILPQAAREYITARATRVFADRVVGSQDLSAMLREDERNARAILFRQEIDAGDYKYANNCTTRKALKDSI